MPNRGIQFIPANQIETYELIGTGEFGTVRRATYYVSGRSETVAVKMAKGKDIHVGDKV